MRAVFVAGAAVLLAQDALDREHSWARGPLRERRTRAAAQSVPASEAARPSPYTPSPHTAHAPERTRPEHPPVETVAFATPSPMPVTTVVREEALSEPDKPVASEHTLASVQAEVREPGQAIPPFRPPAVGSEVAIRLRSGSEMRGKLLALNEQQLEIEMPTLTLALAPGQLAPATRIRFFEADHVRYHELMAERERRTATTASERETKIKSSANDDPFDARPGSEPADASPHKSQAADAFFRAF